MVTWTSSYGKLDVEETHRRAFDRFNEAIMFLAFNGQYLNVEYVNGKVVRVEIKEIQS